MPQLILSQLLLKPIKIESYDKVSKLLLWSIFFIFSIVINIDMLTFGAPLPIFIIMIFIAGISIYSAYIVLSWWLVKQKQWDGKGNLFALIMSASVVDLLFPIVVPFGFIAIVIVSTLSFAVFFQAIRTGFSLTFWQTMNAISISTLSVIVVGIVLMTIANTLGIAI